MQKYAMIANRLVSGPGEMLIKRGDQWVPLIDEDMSLAAPAAVRDAGDNLDVDLGDVREQLDIPKGVRVKDVNEAMQEALDEITERGLNAENGKQLLADMLDERGIEVPNEAYLKTLVQAHNDISQAAASRAKTLNDEDIWGYEYEANTDRHEDIDGVILPKDDPFWDEWYPPNGWNCQCKVRVITNGEAKEEGLEDQEAPDEEDMGSPDPGFDTDFQDLIDDDE